MPTSMSNYCRWSGKTQQNLGRGATRVSRECETTGKAVLECILCLFRSLDVSVIWLWSVPLFLCFNILYRTTIFYNNLAVYICCPRWQTPNIREISSILQKLTRWWKSIVNTPATKNVLLKRSRMPLKQSFTVKSLDFLPINSSHATQAFNRNSV